MKYVLLLPLMIFAYGCASQIPALDSALVNKAPCCASLREITYSNVSGGSSVDYDIDERSPTYDFAEGRSYFVAVALPSDTRKLLITTHLVGGWIPTAQVFWPVLLFLNQNHEPTRTMKQVEMDRSMSWQPLRGGPIWSADIKVEPGEQFLVIYTLQAYVGRKIAAAGPSQGFVFSGGAGPTYVPGSSTKYSTVGPGGYISINVH